jgi:hypothetical protein
MPISDDVGEFTGPADHSDGYSGGHSGARWMVAVALCLIMLGLACTL